MVNHKYNSYVMVTLVEITQNKLRWPMAAGYLMDTHFEFFKLRKDSYMLLSSGGPSGHTNGDCKPSSHLALYPTPLEITQHKNYTQTVGSTVPFLYVHVRKLHGRYHLPDVGPPTEDQWNQ